MNDPQPEGSHGKLYRTTRILSYAAGWRGSVAACGAGAAAGNGGGRIFLVRVVAFYKKCGTCEQWIKEGKGAISLAARPEKREYLRRFEVIRGIPAQC